MAKFKDLLKTIDVEKLEEKKRYLKNIKFYLGDTVLNCYSGERFFASPNKLIGKKLLLHQLNPKIKKHVYPYMTSNQHKRTRMVLVERIR